MKEFFLRSAGHWDQAFDILRILIFGERQRIWEIYLCTLLTNFGVSTYVRTYVRAFVAPCNCKAFGMLVFKIFFLRSINFCRLHYNRYVLCLESRKTSPVLTNFQSHVSLCLRQVAFISSRQQSGKQGCVNTVIQKWWFKLVFVYNKRVMNDFELQLGKTYLRQ